LLIFATALPALAGPFEDAVAKFANDEFSDTEEAIGVLATGGNPLAYTIISALQDGRLMADPDTKKVYVTQPEGKIIDAATGAPVASIPDSAGAVRLNNRLRRGRARWPDVAVARSGQAHPGRAIGFQEP
jgi:urea transport system permease protein